MSTSVQTEGVQTDARSQTDAMYGILFFFIFFMRIKMVVMVVEEEEERKSVSKVILGGGVKMRVKGNIRRRSENEGQR